MISESRERLPTGWIEAESVGWWIGRGADLRLYPLRRRDGTEAGVVLGWVVGEDGLLPDGTVLGGPESGETIADWSADLAGRFLCLIGGEDGRARVLLDAGGLLGAVYDRTRRAIASIPGLLPGGSTRDDALVAEFRVPERHGWYPLGLTPARGVERLMPNFALALDDFTACRIWPLDPAAIPTRDPTDTVPEIYALTSGIARSLARTRDLVAHLTAGYDSRMMLAALGPRAAADVPAVTIALPGKNAALDVHVASRLAARFGLSHQVRPYIPATSADIELWQTRTGECIKDVSSRLARTLASWPAGEVELTGTGGEVSRAFYWRGSDIGAPPPSPDDLLQRLEMPRSARTRQAAEAWLGSLPPMDAVRVWDLVYIEQRLGCWGGPEVYGSPQRIPAIAPFNSRRILAAMMGLPPRYRVNGQLCRDLIAEGWPELNDHPVNSAAGLDRLRFLEAQMKSMLPQPAFDRMKRMKRSFAPVRRVIASAKRAIVPVRTGPS